MSPYVGCIKVKKQQLKLDMEQQSVSSVIQSCPTFYDPMNCSMPGLPVHHHLPEFTQTHVHWVGDAIQSSHPLSSPSLPALNLSSIRVFSNETGSKLGKKYIKAVYCHPAYLTYMQGTPLEMLGWMKHRMESRLPGKLPITSDVQMTPPLWQTVKRN